MSPLPRLHHHDIMTIVGLFSIYVPFIAIRRVIKDSAVHRSRQQCLVAEWLGHGVTVRVRVMTRARESNFSFLFFSRSVLKCVLCLALLAWC